MIQLIFIMPSSQVSAESFDATKQTCCNLPSSLYTSIHCLFAFGAGIWNCTRENEAWYRCPWRNIHFITWIGLVSSVELLVQVYHAVLCYSYYDYVKLSRNQLPVNLFFFCLTRLDPQRDSWFTQESRIMNQVENRDSQWTVNFLLNGNVIEDLLYFQRLIHQKLPGPLQNLPSSVVVCWSPLS